MNIIEHPILTSILCVYASATYCGYLQRRTDGDSIPLSLFYSMLWPVLLFMLIGCATMKGLEAPTRKKTFGP